MKRILLQALVAVICLFKGTSQLVTYFQHPDMIEVAPLLVIVASFAIILMHIAAGCLALLKPFLAFLLLIIVVVTHVILFPLGVAISTGIVLAHNYWSGFMISALSNVLVALLAYGSWRFSRGAKNAAVVRA